MMVERGGRTMARKEKKRESRLPDRSPRGEGAESAGEGGIDGAVCRVTVTSAFGRSLQ